MPGVLSPGKGVPLFLIPEHLGINKGQKVPDRSKTAHRKPLVKCFLTRVVSSAYLRLLIFLPAILIPACASFSPAFLMMYSAYKLNKQGDSIQPRCTPFPIWNQSVVPCPVLTVASWPAYRCSPQEAGPLVWNSHLLKNFPQFVLIHTVKGYGIVNKAKVNVFSWTLLLFWWFNRCWQFPLTPYFPIPYFPWLLHILPEPSFL